MSVAFTVLPSQRQLDIPQTGVLLPISEVRLRTPWRDPVALPAARRVPVGVPLRHDVACTRGFKILGITSAIFGAVVSRRRLCRSWQRRCKQLSRRCLVENAAKTLDDRAVEATYREDVRNLAIIAHVDHGKTTLVDALMKQTSGGSSATEAHMDSNQIEQERGITILAKNAAIKYNGVKINLIDTPGHADFGGEVERILNMADGCLLLVDAEEGPKPQTKFVLRKALELKRKVIVCINKVDKPNARPDWVLDSTFDLFAALDADDDLCDFPVCYASGIKGMASLDSPKALEPTLAPLMDQILRECPKPRIMNSRPLQMLVANLEYNEYLGQLCIGRVISGSLRVGQEVGLQHGEEGPLRKGKVVKLFEFSNNVRVETDEVRAGDICAFSGFAEVRIGDTVVDPTTPLPLPPIVVEEPTVMMEFKVNVSPLAGKGGTKTTLRLLQSRLERESLSNISLRIEPGSSPDSFRVKGRGTLQLGILIENMRREGLELMVGAPETIERVDPDTGAPMEPYEEAVVEVATDAQGSVLDAMLSKGAIGLNTELGAIAGQIVHTFEIPTRGLIGMQNRLASLTHGGAILHTRFSHWGPIRSDKVKMRENGSMFSVSAGVATHYAIAGSKGRGNFWILPGAEVYRGMCVGIHNREGDFGMGLTKNREVTNVRDSSTSFKTEALPTILSMSIDDFLGHMDPDELLEVTPDAVRLSKKPEAISKYVK